MKGIEWKYPDEHNMHIKDNETVWETTTESASHSEQPPQQYYR